MACASAVCHVDDGLMLNSFAHGSVFHPVLDFLPIQQQLAITFLTSRTFRQLNGPDDPNANCWHRLCSSLCTQRQIFVPGDIREQAVLASGRGGWRVLFEELWALRNRFVTAASASGDTAGASSAGSSTDRFRLATYCRFRPSDPRWVEASANSSSRAPLSLPLHQRVSLLRASHPELSAKDAMQQIFAKENQAPSNDGVRNAEAETEVPKASSNGFKASVLAVNSGCGGSVLTVSPGCGLRNFEFDSVFDGDSTQHEVYEQCGVRLVTDLVNGVNGALVLYGQTGSGKTHTMFGPDSNEDNATRGLAVRVADATLSAVVERRGMGFEADVFVSYVEVFGNEVSDLLSDEMVGVSSAVNARIGHRYVIDGDLGHAVQDNEGFVELLKQGDARKRKACTEMNERSTRAHTLLILRLVQSVPGCADNTPPIVSALFLADLGGSERVSKSHANKDVKAPGGIVSNNEVIAKISWKEYYKCKERMTETNHINKGLLSLKRCITALNERQLCHASGRKVPPVPFRDSKLTAVLEPALGGLSRTAIVVCCSPEEYHAEETVQTLRFGEMCGRIEHVQRVTADPTSAVAKALRQIDEQVREVERSICEKERWEWRQTARTDVVNANDAATTRMLAEEEMELGGYGAVEMLPKTR